MDRRRVLEVLAGSGNGCTGALLLARGVSPALLAELIGARLVTATTERIIAGGEKVPVTRIRITSRGREALAKPAVPESVAAGLIAPERVLLFCIASETDWHKFVTPGTVQQMTIRGLIERDGAWLVLTDQGRAVLEVLMMGKATRGA